MSHNTRCEEEWRQLSWLVGCALATGYLHDEKPVSLMILAPPGTGKSSLMQRWYGADTVFVASDITSDSLRHLVLPRMVREGKQHIMFPEFFKIFQRNQSSVANMTGVLSAAMSGELHAVMQGEREMEKLPQDFRVGVIAAMTNDVFGAWKKDFGNTGLLDRFLVVPITMTTNLVRYTQLKVAYNDRSMLVPLSLPVTAQEKKRVRMSDAASEALFDLCHQATKHVSNRFVDQMRAMVKGLAMIHGETEVTARRLDGVHQLMAYIARRKPLEV